MTNKTERNEDLVKSIDEMIDKLFVEQDVEEEESVEKSMIKDDKPQKETADEGEQPPKAQDDAARGAGRPKQISDVPKVDTDGKRAKEYDDDITEEKKDKDGKNPEQDQVKPAPELVKKSEEEKMELSKEEYEEFQSFKKAKEDAERAEDLRKAKEEQADLIKSAVIEATKDLREENESLRKSLEEQGELIKAMANKPQKSKAITNMNAIEKSQPVNQGDEPLSKSELMDIAEDLMKSGKLTVEQAIELDNFGYLYDDEVRGIFEREVRRRK